MLRGLWVPRDGGASRSPLAPDLRRTCRTPFIHPQHFLNYGYILWSEITKLYSQKVSAEHPEKMHTYMDTFTSIVLLVNVETVLLALMNVLKKIFSDTKTNPNPPLSQSDRGPFRDPNQKDFERESPRTNKHFLGHFSFCNCFDSCFSLKLCPSTLSWPPCAFQPSLTSPLDWVEATLFSLCGRDVANGGQNICVLILVEGVTKNRHMCRFFVTPSTQSVSWNGAKQSFLHRFLCPFKTLYIPLYYGWASCTIKLKENSLLDDILAENNKIDRKWKGKSPLLLMFDGATLLLVPLYHI
jgi:hypothetical protein